MACQSAWRTRDVQQRVLLPGRGEQFGTPVQAEEDQPQRRLFDDLVARGRRDAREILQRRGSHHVEFARQQRRDAGRIGLDGPELNPLQIVLGLVPPLLVHDENRLGIGLVALQLERPGAIRVRGCEGGDARGGVAGLQRVVRGKPLPIHDEDAGEVVQQQRIGPLEHEIDGEVVDLLGLHDVRQIAASARAGIQQARHGGDDVVRCEGIAVVEHDAGPQREAPAVRADDLPRRRKRRLDLELAIAPHQRIVDVVLDVRREALGVRIRVHRRDVALRGPAQRLRGCELRQGRRECGPQCPYLH